MHPLGFNIIIYLREFMREAGWMHTKIKTTKNNNKNKRIIAKKKNIMYRVQTLQRDIPAFYYI